MSGGNWLRCLLLVIIWCIVAVQSAHGGCTWSVVGTSSVTTYGTTRDPQTGTTFQVPLYTKITLYWEAECHWDDPIYIPPPNEPQDGDAVTATQSVTITQVNTVNPERPLITAEVFSDSPDYQPNEVSLLVDGYAQQSVPIAGSGTYTLAFPAIRSFGDGNTSIGVEACNAQDHCAEAATILSKSTPSPVEASTTLDAVFLQGDDWVRISYDHRFWQAYATATFSDPEIGENSRRQLKENRTILKWAKAMKRAVPSVRASSEGTVEDTTVDVDWCGSGDQMNPADSTVRCGWFGTYGFMPWVQEWVSDLMTEELEPAHITSGGSLSVTLP